MHDNESAEYFFLDQPPPHKIHAKESDANEGQSSNTRTTPHTSIVHTFNQQAPSAILFGSPAHYVHSTDRVNVDRLSHLSKSKGPESRVAARGGINSLFLGFISFPTVSKTPLSENIFAHFFLTFPYKYLTSQAKGTTEPSRKHFAFLAITGTRN